MRIWAEGAGHARHAVELHLRDELLRRAGVADAIALHVVVHEAHLRIVRHKGQTHHHLLQPATCRGLDAG